MNFLFRFLFISLALFLAACKRENSQLIYSLIQLPVQSKVRCVESFGDSLLLAGGDVNGRGFVVVCDAQLSSFEVRSKSLKREVYDAVLFQNRWYFGMDSAALLTSDNLKKFTNYYWKQADWVSDLSKHPIRKFGTVGNELFAVAGGKLAFGVVYHSSDSAQSWNPVEYENELRSITLYGDEFHWTAWAGGDGILLKSSSETSDWQRIKLDNTFIADVIFQDENRGICVTYEGDIHSTKDGGEHWSLVEKSKKFRSANRLIQSGDWMVIAANDGAFAYSKDSGASWKWNQLEEKLDLSDAIIVGDKLLLTAENGFLVSIKFSELK